MQPVSVHHVSVNVSNPDQTIAFYTDVLGGTVRADRPDFGFGGAWIGLGDAQVHLIEAEVPPNLGQHFAILVDDLDGVVDELRAKGLEVRDPARVALLLAGWGASVAALGRRGGVRPRGARRRASAPRERPRIEKLP